MMSRLLGKMKILYLTNDKVLGLKDKVVKLQITNFHFWVFLTAGLRAG